MQCLECIIVIYIIKTNIKKDNKTDRQHDLKTTASCRIHGNVNGNKNPAMCDL